MSIPTEDPAGRLTYVADRSGLYLSDEQAERLLECIDDRPGWSGLRERALSVNRPRRPKPQPTDAWDRGRY